MKREELIHQGVLVAMLIGSIAAFWFARGNVGYQLAIGIVTAVAYVLWGIIHHLLKKDLHRNIVIEYVLIGVIAIILLVTLMI